MNITEPTTHQVYFRSLRRGALVCCLPWMGCDQFAAIGIEEPDGASDARPSPPAQGDAGDASDASDRDSAAPDGGDGSADSGKPDSGPECAALDVAVCNPVKNEGCPASLQMQCAVSFDAPLTGYCIFFSGGPPPTLAGACLNTVVTESCPPKFTCVAEQCRRLCFCNSDCEAGQCCTEPLHGTGFKVCGDC